MRTTVDIDGELLGELKTRAQQEGTTLTDMVNRVLRAGLASAEKARSARKRAYREQVFSLGSPYLALDKALTLAAALEDREVVEEMARRK